MTKILYIPAGEYVRFLGIEDSCTLVQIIEESYFKQTEISILLCHIVSTNFNLNIKDVSDSAERSPLMFEIIDD